MLTLFLYLLGSLTLACIFLVVYHHALYPFSLQAMAKRIKPQHPINNPNHALPHLTIAMIIPAFNEEKTIRDKLYNIVSLNYPSKAVDFYIVLDGCTDNTHGIILNTLNDIVFADCAIHILHHKDNQGKIARLNKTVDYINQHKPCDIIAFSDVSALVSYDALALCAMHFNQAHVGVVTGFYRLLAPANNGENTYWAYQCQQQAAESALGAVQGAHGAFYAIRANLYTPLPADTINDDFIIPMQIVSAGFKAIMDININALELEQTSPQQEIHRRIRIAAGNAQQFIRLRHLLNPKYHHVAFMFASGKVLRVFMPYLMALALFGSLLLATFSSIFMAAAMGQCIIYSLALLSLWGKLKPFKKMAPLGYLLQGHYLSALGSSRYVWDALTGKHRIAIRHKMPTPLNEANSCALDPTTTRAKRVFDVCIASTALMLLAPIMPLIALAIKCESCGPIFFSQVRIGLCTPQKTHYFTMYKFRSMVQDAEKKTGATLAKKNDARITRVGYFLRKTRLDELPQLFNVLRGDMSIVGPRPERPDFYGKLETAIPFFAERTYGVLPGITGLAQVYQGYDTCIEDVRSKVGYDHGYALALHNVRSWLRMDLWIMFKTLEVMIMGRGQ